MTILDDIDRRLLGLLSEDARQPMAALGAAVGLSTSAVNERVRRLADQGAIRRVMADCDPEAVGRPVFAFIFIGLAPGADEAAFRRFAAGHPAIVACHHVTGGWSYLVQARLASLAAVEDFLSEMKGHGWLGRSETMLSLSAVVDPPFRLAGGAA